jgi:membrane glycosyltransferase
MSMPLAEPHTVQAVASPRWNLARERAEDYLRAAGLDHAAARLLSEAAAARCASRADVDSTDDAIRVTLESVREELWGPEGPDGLAGPHEPVAPRLHIRSQTLGSVIDWRRAAWRLRRLIVPNTMRRRDEVAIRAAELSRKARVRRLAFTALVLGTTLWGTNTFLGILSVDGLSVLDLAHTAVFAVLLLWLAQSFWSLTAGAGVILGRLWSGPATPTAPCAADVAPRVALVMPIYNEPPERIFAGLQAMWEDLTAHGGAAERFDLFILSDTTDPDVWLAELEAWHRLRDSVPGGERIFYRRRLRNRRRKSGNIEDFLVRWGGGYGYMLVLDADSIMSARTMVALAERMDANPHVGLIQAPPKLVRGRSLFARMLQLAGELYGPLSASGISYWAMGEGNYWGHNAIIRIAPWVRLCGLPLLPGRAPLGGEILSHDFVEAALMRRGGWQVWIADDLAESYEEPPPGIEEFATRDRRWCQGNLQHIRVLFGRNLHWVSRLHLAIGVMAYLTSPLWLLFLVLAAAQAWQVTYTQPVYFVENWPFPLLPVSVGHEAAFLLAATLGLLFAPRLMGLGLALLDGERRRRLGGATRIVASALLETLFSALLAPVMMLMHTRFVLAILFGAAIEWTAQKREAARTAFAEAWRRFGWISVLGVAATIAAAVATPILLLWLIPVVAGWCLAVPLVLLSARTDLGERLRRHGLLLIAEETDPPAVLRRLDEIEEDAAPPPGDPFVRAILDPRRNALHLELLERHGDEVPAHVTPMLERKAVYLGPAALDKAERRALLEDRDAMRRLHLLAWVHWPTLGVRP